MTRPIAVALVVGLIAGFVLAVAIVAPLQITPDHAWALTGSALGAILAIGGSLLVFRYEQREKELGDRRRIGSQLEEVLRRSRDFEASAAPETPRFTEMETQMREMGREYRAAMAMAEKYRHTSIEIERAFRELSGHAADEVQRVAMFSQQTEPKAAAISNGAVLVDSARRAKAKLKV
jgi:hypothetical protein